METARYESPPMTSRPSSSLKMVNNKGRPSGRPTYSHGGADETLRIALREPANDVETEFVIEDGE
jgi:hypothetical protein